MYLFKRKKEHKPGKREGEGQAEPRAPFQNPRDHDLIQN